jgi:hypothetical protein
MSFLDVAAMLGHKDAQMLHLVYGHKVSDPEGDRRRIEENDTERRFGSLCQKQAIFVSGSQADEPSC